MAAANAKTEADGKAAAAKRFPDTSYPFCRTDTPPISEAKLDDAAAHLTEQRHAAEVLGEREGSL